MGDELVFTTTAGAYVFASIFAALGAIFCIVSAAGGFVDMSGVMGLAFFAFGFWYLWHLRQKECKFDRYSRKLIQGERSFDLIKIGAIQLIREYIRGNESNYYSYELNLVCLNGERINIVDHGALRKLREDALILANYLSVPIWDAIDFRLPDSDDLVDGKVEVLRQNLG